MRRTFGWAVLMALLVVGCGGESGTQEAATADVSEDAKRGGLAVACAQAAPEGLNPFVSADQLSADLRLLLFTPLVLYGDAGEFRPYLARSWRWEDEGQRLILELRDDVEWHDGMPVTAEDVAWTIRAAADTAYTYWSQNDFSTLSDVTVSDSVDVVVEFSEPYTAGLEPFVSLPILPSHLLESVPVSEFRTAPYHREPVGSGPFRFAGRATDESIRLDRFEGFPAELGTAYLDRIVFRAVPEATTLQTEIGNGSIDMCITGFSAAERVQGMRGGEVQLAEPTGVLVVPLNMRHPALADVRVRRALSAALRRAEIASLVSDLVPPTRTFLPPSSPWIEPGLVEPDADSAMAAGLLDEAGWTLEAGSATRTNAAGEPLQFTLVGPTGFEDAGTVIQAQLASLGVDLELRRMEGSAFISTIVNPETRPDMMAVVLYPEKFLRPDVRGQFHTDGNANLSFYSNTEVDSLIERVGDTVETEELRALYTEIQRHVVRDVPAIHVAYLPRPVAIGPRLEGVSVDLNGPFASVNRWWIPPAERRGGR